MKKYEYNLVEAPYYILEENHFRINQFMQEIKQNYKNCKNENSLNCNIYKGIVVKKKNNYLFLFKK